MGGALAIGELTAAQSKALDSHLRAIDEAKSAMVVNVLSIGEHLGLVRVLLKESGLFKGWVEQNCGFSKATAYNYMQAHEVFGGVQRVGLFSDSAMYLLSKGSVPEEAAAEAIKKAKRGVRITESVAKEIVKGVRERFSEPDEPAGDKAAKASRLTLRGMMHHV